MTSDLMLRRKWTFKAHGQQVVFVKKRNEKSTHVLMKAFLWALYLPVYPNLVVEIKIGDRFKPDVVSLNDQAEPLFWGESGQVSVRKIRSLVKRYPQTHFAIAKWDTSLHPHRDIVSKALQGIRRTAPFDLLAFPADSVERFINDQGNIQMGHEDLEWIRLDSP